jgi:16S rRNA processing protein RimM
MTQPNKPPYLILAEIHRPHGVRGEVRARILTDYPERLKTLKTVYLGADPKNPKATTYTIESIRFLPEDIALFKFEGINDRNNVENLRDMYIMIDTDNAVPLEDDEFYTYQLIGVTLLNENGHVLGKVMDVMETGANDVLIVDSPEYGELLIPETPNLWVDLDFENGFVTIKLPDGLLPS